MKSNWFHRSPWLALASLVLLLFVASPVAFAAGSAIASPPGSAAVLDQKDGHLLGGVLALGLLGALAVQGDKKEGEGDDAPVSAEDALKAMNDDTIPFMQRFKIMGRALAGTGETKQIANLQGEYDRAMSELKASQGDLEKAKADLETANEKLQAKEADLKALDEKLAAAEKRAADAEAKEQDLTKRAKAMADERMKELGFKASELPPARNDNPADDPKKAVLQLTGTARIVEALKLREKGAGASN